MLEEISLNDCTNKMESVILSVKKNFSGLRTGRASVSLLDNIKVDAYGNPTPIAQLGNISVPESKMLSIQVWDKSLVKSIEKAVFDSDLGLTPALDGQLIRIPMPELTAERRKEIAKLAAKYAEQGKISVRNIRREFIEQIKKLEKDRKISEDELHKMSKEIQSITDDSVVKIEELFTKKESDIINI